MGLSVIPVWSFAYSGRTSQCGIQCRIESLCFGNLCCINVIHASLLTDKSIR